MRAARHRGLSWRARCGWLVLCFGAACHAQRPAPNTAGALASDETTGEETTRAALPASVARYETRAIPEHAIVGPQARELGDAIARAANARGGSVAPDARLSQLAQWIAEQRRTAGAVPSAAAMDLAARQLGLVEPLPTISVIATSDARALPDRAFEEASAFFAERTYSHYGGFVEQRAGSVTSVLAFAQRFLALTPTPRRLPVDAALSITGRLAPGYASPELAITFPDGHVERTGARAGERVQWSAETRGPGIYRVEVLAESVLGTTVVANYPVYVGVEPPEHVAIASPTPTGDRAEPRAALLAMINAERARAGVPALAMDGTLAATALAHSRDMLAHGFIGHTSPTTGTATDRVARAGVRTSVVLENIGRGYSVREVHDGLMSSPGHRSNIVHAQATHVGVGVVIEPDHDRTAYLVTELFMRVSRELRADDAQQLLAAVNRRRDADGARPLRLDGGLGAIAQRAAERYFGEPPPTTASVMNTLRQQLARNAASARKVSAALTVVGGVDDLIALDALHAKHARTLGIGLAQGTRSDGFPDAICAVLLIGE